MSYSREDILKILSEDPLRYCNSLGFFRQYDLLSYEKVGNSYLLRGHSDRDRVFFAVDDIQDLHGLSSCIQSNDKVFCAVDISWLPYLDIPGKETAFTADQYYFPAEKYISRNDHTMDSLTEKDVPVIYETLKHAPWYSQEYLKDRIRCGVSACLRNEQGKPIAWGGTHDDGAIGFVHVEPDHRGQGLAQKTVLSLTRQLQTRHENIFAQIAADNTASLGLFAKMGFIKLNTVCWIDPA